MNTRRRGWLQTLILLAVCGLLLAACAAPAAAPTQAPAQAISPPSSRDTGVPQKESPAASQAPPVSEAPAATEAPAAQPEATEAPAPAQPAHPTRQPADSAVAPAPTASPAAGGQQGTEPGKVEVETSRPPQATRAAPTNPAPTAQPGNAAQPTPPTLVPASPTPPSAEEARLVQVEWPETMRLGESDLIRLTLVPASQGYTLVTEYPEHTTITQTVAVPRPAGYTVYAVARLDGVGFQLAPEGEQAQFLPADQRAEWRWSLTPRQAGRQRLGLALWLRWVPERGSGGPTREVSLYNRSLEVRVVSFLGMTQSQALLTGLFSLLFGGGLGAFSLAVRPHPGRALARLRTPGANPDLAIELPPRASAPLQLSPGEQRLLQTLFNRYSRLVIEQEFLSGYSGARAFLARPILPDGRADAYTIAKLGEQETIRQEFANYETYVKDTLPPITARIQHAPVAVRAGGHRSAAAGASGTAGETSRRSLDPASPGRLAAIQYTFIGQAGQAPLSLRQALLNDPAPGLLHKLMDTFGPNWWLQRRPYTFRLAQEYDRLLPAHLVIEPLESGQRAAGGKAVTLDGRTPPGDLSLEIGEVVRLRHFQVVEQHSGRQPGNVRLSLAGQPPAGHPPLRVRWLSTRAPEGALGRVSATRHTLLVELAGKARQQAEAEGLPDALRRLPSRLAETVAGSQSTIHGDLNLENILLGPGGLVWLIDFAQTRDGHTLLDFAHLSAELIAHILAPQIADLQAYLALLRDPGASPHAPLLALLTAAREMACRCLFNPFQEREFDLALSMACLGALKYTNLGAHQRELLYLTAAYRMQQMERE